MGLGEEFSKNFVSVLEGGAAALCEAPRGCGVRGALGFSAQVLGAAGRLEAPRGRSVRGAHELSAQAPGAAGLRGKAPRGL